MLGITSATVDAIHSSPAAPRQLPNKQAAPHHDRYEPDRLPGRKQSDPDDARRDPDDPPLRLAGIPASVRAIC
jgi:hypothetical protein